MWANKVTNRGREMLAVLGMKVKALPKSASVEHEYGKKLVVEK